MKRVQSELLNTQGNAGDDQNRENSGELIQRKEIPNTPFTLVGTEKGWFIGLGMYRLTEPVETETEAFDMLITHQWHIIGAMQMAFSEVYLKNMTEHWKSENK